MSGYAVYRAVAVLSRRLPEKLAYWLGLRIADLFYWRDRPGRAAVRNNLARIFEFRGVQPAEAALDGLARKTFQYFGKYLVDFFRFSQLTEEDLRRRVSLEHFEYVRQVWEEGRGGVLVTAHFGNWELAGAVLTALGYVVNAVVLPQRLEKLNRLFQHQRERRGIRVLPLNSSPFALLRCLKRREFLALVADRDYTGGGELCEFFGRPARMPTGPARLAWGTGAPVLVGFLLREVDDTFRLRVYPPLRPSETSGPEEIRRRIVDILEKEIGERPYQWFMFTPFWEADPSGGAP